MRVAVGGMVLWERYRGRFRTDNCKSTDKDVYRSGWSDLDMSCPTGVPGWKTMKKSRGLIGF
jgi:hypothetical protein